MKSDQFMLYSQCQCLAKHMLSLWPKAEQQKGNQSHTTIDHPAVVAIQYDVKVIIMLRNLFPTPMLHFPFFIFFIFSIAPGNYYEKSESTVTIFQQNGELLLLNVRLDPGASLHLHLHRCLIHVSA